MVRRSMNVKIASMRAKMVREGQVLIQRFSMENLTKSVGDDPRLWGVALQISSELDYLETLFEKAVNDILDRTTVLGKKPCKVLTDVCMILAAKKLTGEPFHLLVELMEQCKQYSEKERREWRRRVYSTLKQINAGEPRLPT